MPIKRARRRKMSWTRRGRSARSRVPLNTPLQRIRQIFPKAKFAKCETHTSVDKSKYPIGTIWKDTITGQFGRVVGYPLNDYYHNDYVGLCYFDERGQYIAYGASRAVNLKPIDKFPRDFRPIGEPRG